MISAANVHQSVTSWQGWFSRHPVLSSQNGIVRCETGWLCDAPSLSWLRTTLSSSPVRSGFMHPGITLAVPLRTSSSWVPERRSANYRMMSAKVPQQPVADDPSWLGYRYINSLACLNGPGASMLDSTISCCAPMSMCFSRPRGSTTGHRCFRLARGFIAMTSVCKKICFASRTSSACSTVAWPTLEQRCMAARPLSERLAR